MKNIKDYILEACQSCKIDREDFEEKCPNFWRAVSQFCRDKNSESGIDYIITAWTCQCEDELKKAFPNAPFSGNEMREFEEKYLDDKAMEEIEKYKKN